MTPTRNFKYCFSHNLYIDIASPKYDITYQKSKYYFIDLYSRSSIPSPLLKKRNIMALSALLTVVGSTGADPKLFTLASPSLAAYQMTSTMIAYGNYTDSTTPQNAAGIVANGYVNIQYHQNNQWRTATLYTTQTGAQINTLVVA